MAKIEKWSEEEIKLLKENYSNLTIEECMRLLPNRSKNAITSKAFKLGCTYKNIPYSIEEDRILETYYPLIGIKCSKYLIGRSDYSIHIRANILGLSYGPRYTEEEDKIIKEYYCKNRSKVFALLPNKSARSIYCRASLLGVTSPNTSNSGIHRKWSDEEKNIMREWYPKIGADCVKMLNGRSRNSVSGMAARMNLVSNTEWKDSEYDIIRKYYPDHGTKECMKYLPNRSSTAIRQKAAFLGVEFIRDIWSEEDDNVIKAYYPNITKIISNLPHKKIYSIHRRCKQIMER